MVAATITSKGQITLPREVREHFHLTEGDRVEFVIEPGGQVRLRPVTGSIRKLFGMLRRSERPVPSLEAMEETLLESLAEDDARMAR
jgi:AbrB family looped-hinge helix DNA binding protein